MIPNEIQAIKDRIAQLVLLRDLEKESHIQEQLFRQINAFKLVLEYLTELGYE